MLIVLFAGMLLQGISLYGQTANGTTTNGSREILVTENFDYPIGGIPAEWTLDGPPFQWKISDSDWAGGQAPELYLGYSFVFGTGRLISPNVNVAGYSELMLKYRQYLINYEADYGEIIGVDVTFDGGQTWQIVWENVIGVLNMAPGFYEYYFSVPEGATEMQYAFRFEGNSFAINMWLIDDLTIESVATNDLIANSINGTITPIRKSPTDYVIEVLNAGSATQSNYTVKLMSETEGELASLAGTPIAFAEKVTYTLTWTPGDGYPANSAIYGVVELANDENEANNTTRYLPMNVQTDDMMPVVVGTEFVPVNFMPYNFFNLHSLTQTLYFPDEIGMSNHPIKGLVYTAHFDNDKDDIHIRIMMGETDATNLTDQWIDPTTLRLVFDGLVDFKKGLNQVYMQLDTSYLYTGRNLVLYSAKSYDEQIPLTPFICSVDSNSQRSRAIENDEAPFDMLNPPPFGYSVDVYPNVTFLYSTTETSTNNILNPVLMQVYPNPARDIMYVKAEERITSLQIINSMGQEITHLAPLSNQVNLNVSKLVKGIYYIKIVTPTGVATTKVKVL